MAVASAPEAAAVDCPSNYTSLQVRVQPNTSIAWTRGLTVSNGTNVHIGVFYNGWGTPVANGSVDLYAIEGSLAIPISTGWDTWWRPSRASRWSFQAFCHGRVVSTDTATVTWN
ncbi:hypothetical protein [Pyxidicoccus xibeiensis]|uniref:hypothetical protein n=1 Tax=Pyxidicoccus xibeiensis TaxID=2906759 RepID=UPI0020A751BC|nr:hypothetical protein [Pyxidicoccus xibeiensis]MCP3140493.1 hypothetical protein [Pyxidicoccus xibeiensis]